MPFLGLVRYRVLTGRQARACGHPFDLPEAEAELVSGYNVEYSGAAILVRVLQAL